MHTKAYLTDTTKKEVYEIARTIANEKGITGISKFTKDKLIDFILEHQTEEVKPEPTQTEEIIEFTSVPTPEEFFT